jgi:general secretion pathway protein G
MRNGKKRRAGFTLIELVVVVLILTILMAITVAIVRGVINRARAAATDHLVKTLSVSCEIYRQDFNVYPIGRDSMALHQALGSPRMVVLDYGPPRTVVKKGPIIEFTMGMLEPNAPSSVPPPASKIMDNWGNEIHYLNPGVRNKKGVDIWSDAADSKSEEDDITNWGH